MTKAGDGGHDASAAFFTGLVTALRFKYDEGSQRVELGYVLGRSHWRQGYAAEALGT